MSDAHAIVVLPPGAYGRLGAAGPRRWLSRGRVSFATPDSEVLLSVLSVIDAPLPDCGLAPFRFWGQTGERSNSWIAAADPVHFETRLRHLVVRAFIPGEVPVTELRALFETLQSELGTDGGCAFARIGPYGYLRGAESVAVPAVSASIADGRAPDEFAPSGDRARSYHQLQGELQMLLHEHAVNQRREHDGLRVINSLWFWGGGVAPEREERPLATLFANDPLLAGYWKSCAAATHSWQGDLQHCLSVAADDFIAVVPEVDTANGADILVDCLEQLRLQLRRGDLTHATLVFRDGLTVEISRRDLVKFWRGISPMLKEHDSDE